MTAYAASLAGSSNGSQLQFTDAEPSMAVVHQRENWRQSPGVHPGGAPRLNGFFRTRQPTPSSLSSTYLGDQPYWDVPANPSLVETQG